MEGNSARKRPPTNPNESSNANKKPRISTKIEVPDLTDLKTLIEIKNNIEGLKNFLVETLEPSLNNLKELKEGFNIHHKRLTGLFTVQRTSGDVITDVNKRFTNSEKQYNKIREDLNKFTNKVNELSETQNITSKTFLDLTKALKKSEKIKNNIESQRRLVESAKKKCMNETNKQRKCMKTIKKQVVKGDEFQRILQILLRQRALSCPGAEVGIEVSGVGSLDDAVYRKTAEKKCRFFQMKHSEIKSTVTTKELFKYVTVKEDIESSTSENTTGRVRKYEKTPKPDFHLLMYFPSFCQIKENPKFDDCRIEEVTLITNRTIERSQRNEDFGLLVEKGSDFENDECLDFNSRKAKKYGLNFEEAHKKYFEFLLKESKKYLTTKIDDAKKITEEFIKKIHIVVNYFDLKELRERTFDEVLGDKIFHMLDRGIFENAILYFEIQLLQSPNEFTNNEGWESIITDIKNLIYSLKSVTLSDVKRKDVQKEVGLYISFENVNDIYEDMKNLINDENKYILDCIGSNFKINFIKVIHILQGKFPDKKFLFCDYNQLLTADCLLEAFDSGKFEILVVLFQTNLSDEDEHLRNRLVNALEKSKKMIIVSEQKNMFTQAMEELLTEKYVFKEYNHGYKNLTPSCKEELQKMPIVFQNKHITFGKLINDDLANEIIDDNYLWDILQKSETHITISDESSFCSPGYNTEYYIHREFYKKTIPLINLATYLLTNVFFVTRRNEITENEVKRVFKKHFISEYFIKNWENKTQCTTGIFLCDKETLSENQLSDLVSNPMTNVHWICMNESAQSGNLILIDSTDENFAENKLIRRHKRQFIKEESLLMPLSNGSTDGKGRLFILVGDSGVGKSTTLTNIANNIRECYPNKWVSRVILRNPNVMKVLEKTDSKSPDQAIHIACKLINSGQSSSSLEKNLLREGLKSVYKGTFGFILLLDGFNEINSALQVKLVTLIKTLMDHCNIDQIWITTQHHGKVKLESELEATSYFLKPLDADDQIKLMVQYWLTEYKKKSPTIKYDLEELRGDAQVAIAHFKSCIYDEEKRLFTENSLNIKMLADVLLYKGRKINEQLKIFDLYDVFVQQKFSIHRQETAMIASNNMPLVSIQDKLFESFVRDILQQLAVKNILNSVKWKTDIKKIFETDALETLKTYIGESDSGLSLSKLGIVILRKNEFDFLHPTFAYYFFCKYLQNNLASLKTDLKIFMVQFVFSADSFQTLRRFLDRALCKLEESNPSELEKITNKLATSYTKTLIQQKKNSSAPIKENLYHVSLFILRWLLEGDFHKYLEKILNQDFMYCNIVKPNITNIIENLKKISKKESVKLLINLYTNMRKSEEIQATVHAILIKSEENHENGQLREQT